MTVVCCLAPLEPAVVRSWLPVDTTLRMVEPGNAVRDCAGADIVIGDTLHRVKLGRRFFTELADGAFFQQPSVGYDVIDIEAAHDSGVTVANAAGYNSSAVADWVVGAVYTLVRGLHWRHTGIRSGAWPTDSPARELAASTVGLLGYGHIGQAVAARLAPLTRVVLYSDVRDAGGAGCRVGTAELLVRSDVLSVQLPLTDETRGLIGADELAAMPAGAVLISAGRGGVVDENALFRAVDSGHLGGAALDVFDTEPLAADSPLRRHDRILLSPHVAGVTRQAEERLMSLLQDNIGRVLRGAPPLHRITAPRNHCGADRP